MPISVPVTIDNTIGAILIGFAVSCVFYGVFVVQAWTYFQKYPLDRPHYKLLVAAVWIISTLEQVALLQGTYYYTITTYGNFLATLSKPIIWTLMSQVLVGAILGTIVKIAYAMRVWRFSGRNVYITSFLIFLTLAAFALSIVYTIAGLRAGNFAILAELNTTATLALGAGVLTDALTAGTLCLYLRRYRTGRHTQADTLVKSLMRYAINCGMLTSLASICCLVTYNIMPNNLIFAGIYFVLSKFYANSLLATLNTRRSITGRGTDQESGRTGTANQTGSTFYMIEPMPATSRRDHQNSQNASRNGREQKNPIIFVHSSTVVI